MVHYENQWGTLGADTVSASSGALTLWASNEGLRVRLDPGIVDIKEGREIISRHRVMPSMVDFVIVNGLGRMPIKDVEAVVAMLTILSSCRGHRIAHHMSPRF
jgi:hypothetical protein